MKKRKVVIYCSSWRNDAGELKRQEKQVRTTLAEKGVNAAKAVVLRETRFATGPAYRRLHKMVVAGRVRVLAMTSIERLDRGLAASFVVAMLERARGRVILVNGKESAAEIEKMADKMLRGNANGIPKDAHRAINRRGRGG
jgi:hypothetical protein